MRGRIVVRGTVGTTATICAGQVRLRRFILLLISSWRTRRATLTRVSPLSTANDDSWSRRNGYVYNFNIFRPSVRRTMIKSIGSGRCGVSFCPCWSIPMRSRTSFEILGKYALLTSTGKYLLTENGSRRRILNSFQGYKSIKLSHRRINWNVSLYAMECVAFARHS